jgi:hypothetical protein
MIGNTIRWLILSVVVAVAGVSIYYKYEATRPCAEPIAYSIGAIDPRFGISQAALLTTTEEAIAIWNKAAGKTVLTYDPKGALKVNLIYDEREATAKLGILITEASVQADIERAALEALRSRVNAAESAYNRKVKAINASGGASPAQAAELTIERKNLQSMVTNLNSAVAAFNKSIAALNTKVREYNETAGHTFEEGQYVRDGDGERINIFEFVGSTQLERVLAHEFGHAVGLDHNDDPNSIMYAKNESGNLVPTDSDIAALKTVCGLK